MLQDAGYQTGAFVGAYVLDRRFGLADGFDTYDDRIRRNPDEGARLEAERPGSEVVDAAIGVADNQATSRFFMWVHLYDPHAPYEPPGGVSARRPAAMPTTAKSRTRTRRSLGSSTRCGRAGCRRPRSSS